MKAKIIRNPQWILQAAIQYENGMIIPLYGSDYDEISKDWPESYKEPLPEQLRQLIDMRPRIIGFDVFD
jgi:hypothetical protein